jgi:flagellar biosynthesis/type III secretory pathway M-ring protein FliF/YscJ
MELLKELTNSIREWWAESPVKTKVIIGAVIAVIIAVILTNVGGK